MTNPRGIRAIDARNGCYGNEEATADDGAQDTQRLSHDWGRSIRPSLRSEQELTRVSEIAGDGNRVSSARTAPMRVEIGQTRARLGASVEAGSIKYDGNLLPAMTAMVTGFVDKLTQERAKLFRETTRALLPEFAYLIKQGGDPNHAPHDCIDNLSTQLVCRVCGAAYTEAK